MTTHRGRCLCGATSFAFDGPPDWVLHCHCESCRRATASPMTTFACVPDGRLAWEGHPPSLIASSPGVVRGFCRTCGSPLLYRTAERPGETHLYAALLLDPGAVTPQGHDFAEDRLPWMDPLPRVEEAP